jgi:hypothetical protein
MNNSRIGENSGFRRNARLITAAVSGLVALALPGFTGVALADDPPIAMAPPVANSVPPPAGTDNVFQWTEIPANEQVPLTRAVFDQGGYQLYDTSGETVVVPFTNQNLYVMKFAVSPNNTLYFINESGTPVLYVPRNGYLENASVPGAKWYPFSEQFAPTQPVYLGVAPSYTEFVDVGWYPNTVIYGGYYCSTPFIAGVIFRPTLGLTFIIGGHPYYGWHDYHHYVVVHPAPYHMHYVNEHIYHVSRVYAAHDFHGYVGYHTHAVEGGRMFHGAISHSVSGDHFGDGHSDRAASARVFHGADHSGVGADRAYHGSEGHSSSGDHASHGNDGHTSGGGDHDHHGGR